MADVPVRRENYPERTYLRRREPRSWDPSEFSLSPWSLMRRFNDEMDRWFGGSRETGETDIWSPNIEVREQNNNLIVCADLPGLNKDDVKVEMTEEGLAIQGERKREQEENREGYYRSERSYGSFYRVIPLPEGVNAEQAKANFKDGVLEITMPMPEGAKRRRQIPVEGAPKTRTSGGGA